MHKKVLLLVINISLLAFLIVFLKIKSNHTHPTLPWIKNYKSEEVANGYNFVITKFGTEAFLLNNYGKILHRWKNPGPQDDYFSKWYFGTLLPDMRLIYVNELGSMGMLSADSTLLWERMGGYTHDIKMISKKSFGVIQYLPKEIIFAKRKCAVIDSVISIHDLEGKTIKEISLLKILIPYIKTRRINKACSTTGLKNISNKQIWITRDIIHANSFQFLEKNYNDIFQEGNLLISSKYLNLIALIDVYTNQVKWHSDKLTTAQHHATLSHKGEIIAFNNKIRFSKKNQNKILKRSSAIIFDPINLKINYEYGLKKGQQKMFSSWGGGVQELKNNNLLISVPDDKIAFELNEANEIVWLFDLAKFEKENKLESEGFFRLVRYNKDYFIHSNLK